jgi:two-component system, response regulator
VPAVDILLVEDNRHDIEMIMYSFEEHGMRYHMLAVQDGAKALDYFFGDHGCLHGGTAQMPRLIMLDLKLPRVNGVEVLKRLKSDTRTRHIPVVVFTSSNESRDKLECYSLGVNSYIVKPLDSDEFSRFVADIGSYWIRMNAMQN